MWTKVILWGLQIYFPVALRIGPDIYLWRNILFLEVVIRTPLFSSYIIICLMLLLGLRSKNKNLLPDKYMKTPVDLNQAKFYPLIWYVNLWNIWFNSYPSSYHSSNWMNLLSPNQITRLTASKLCTTFVNFLFFFLFF